MTPDSYRRSEYPIIKTQISWYNVKLMANKENKPGKGILSTRNFIKLAGVAGGGVLLEACKMKPSQVSSTDIPVNTDLPTPVGQITPAVSPEIPVEESIFSQCGAVDYSNLEECTTKASFDDLRLTETVQAILASDKAPESFKTFAKHVETTLKVAVQNGTAQIRRYRENAGVAKVLFPDEKNNIYTIFVWSVSDKENARYRGIAFHESVHASRGLDGTMADNIKNLKESGLTMEEAYYIDEEALTQYYEDMTVAILTGDENSLDHEQSLLNTGCDLQQIAVRLTEDDLAPDKSQLYTYCYAVQNRNTSISILNLADNLIKTLHYAITNFDRSIKLAETVGEPANDFKAKKQKAQTEIQETQLIIEKHQKQLDLVMGRINKFSLSEVEEAELNEMMKNPDIINPEIFIQGPANESSQISPDQPATVFLRNRFISFMKSQTDSQKMLKLSGSEINNSV